MDEREMGKNGGEGEAGEVGVERRRVAEITSELRRRARPDYLREQARGAMVRRTTDLRNRAIRSPIVLGIAGSILGMTAARLIRSLTASKREERIEWEPAYGGGRNYATDEGRYVEGRYVEDEEGQGIAGRVRDKAAQLGESVKEGASDLKDRAVELKDRAGEKMDQAREAVTNKVAEVRDRLPSTEQIKGGVSRAYRFSTEEQPALGGVLAVAAGVALGMLLPVSDAEEQVLAPAREKAAENLGMLEDRVRSLADNLENRISNPEEPRHP